MPLEKVTAVKFQIEVTGFDDAGKQINRRPVEIIVMEGHIPDGLMAYLYEKANIPYAC